ncbi:Fatty acid oxidation complex subunit alpha [BD1-7 clade bacterium]|uniref:enoyl-CoA hydratase n=1 Tax=BD1-7 clade bacterium TaxID=2029982 RepID=A0A5S9QRK6_9GAMM|nr:Fatty acid oxidation complex subunit alpha [BD1-7 clade bacterium]CAA0122585.1 Fatty acid oxidation complex subunit alpha [BD1-7 clade bacterium]
MIFQGETISVSVDDAGIATMLFDNKHEPVNKFDLATLDELKASVTAMNEHGKIQGLLIESRKDSFVVGADIKQFHSLFDHSEEEIAANVVSFNEVFAGLEDVPFPTVSLVDGIALGGGLELALSTDFRVLSTRAKVGLPEVKLGINPGFGGTIRLPRLIGVDNAVEWIATGKEYRPDAALAVGLADAVVASDQLVASGLSLIAQANAGKLSIARIREVKTNPVMLNDMERIMAFTTAKGLVASQAGPNMPAPLTSVKSIEKSCSLHREAAIKVEAKYFSRLAKTEVSGNLIGLFLNEQDLSKRNKTAAQGTASIDKVAVVGAGIMGGGIAYQAGFKGKQVVMKDVAQAGLDQGMEEATKLLSKRVDRGRMSAAEMAHIISRIHPVLHYEDFSDADAIVEAVVERLDIKQSVLSEVEKNVPTDTVIASNTSTLSISKMAEGIARPENFCGMHFFNPVHRMPLVEVIRGAKTSEATVGKVVKLALDMGKTPIVVNDCPGFYVNRVLFPYLNGFNLLVRDGADFLAVDKVMEKWGWPMGPAYLIDVVGIDTGCHAAQVMAEGFPGRMQFDEVSAMQLMLEANRLGQKNGAGFYSYQPDKKGKPRKAADDTVSSVIAPAVTGQGKFTDEEVIERLMIPMCFEVARCIEDGIVSNAVDADMGLLMGIGFPLFRGGPIRYIESVGIANMIEQSKKYHDLGAMYHAPELLKKYAANGKSLFAFGGAA